jgi:hypothetical protein
VTPTEPVPDQVASAAIEEFFDDPYLPIVNKREVYVEGVGLVRIKQESVYSNKDTGVLKRHSIVEEVTGLYLPELFVDLSTGEDQKSPILSGKRAASISIRPQSKHLSQYRKDNSSTLSRESVPVSDIEEGLEGISLESDLSDSVRENTLADDCNCVYCLYRDLEDLFGTERPKVIYLSPKKKPYTGIPCLGPCYTGPLCNGVRDSGGVTSNSHRLSCEVQNTKGESRKR